MKRTLSAIAVPLAAVLLAAPTADAAWQIDPAHTQFIFKVKHLMISTVTGHFDKFDGQVTYNPDDPTKSSATGTIDVASINTANEKRDAHLRSPDFFDAANFPTMTFKTTRIINEGGKMQVVCDLTIRGITREVTLDVVSGPSKPVTIMGAKHVGAALHGVINRTDFGLAWNMPLETGGFVVSEEVELEIELELVEM